MRTLLKGKNVVVGVCGGIAAYKVVEVVSRFKKMGADVNVIMTENATRFVAPLTFRSISHNPVVAGMFEDPADWDIKHVSLADRADMILIAPATANMIGKIANGIADDMLTTTVMASKAPVLFVPAMNHNMYENGIFQENMARLKNHGYMFMEPDTGIMACGTSGKGRLPEPEAIAAKVAEFLTMNRDLKGIRFLITAGPTREPIDPVRYLSNHSSGKMGYAVAAAASARGAEVKLISGPVNLRKLSNVETVCVTTAEEMYREALRHHPDCDVAVFAAAVADYRCESVSDVKIKKKDDRFVIHLVKNPDIAGKLGAAKENRIHIGFSAETNDLLANAASKLHAKNFDMVVANDVTMEGAGFGTDTNIVKFVKRDGTLSDLPLMDKADVAHKILDEVVKMLRLKNIE